MVAQTPIVNMSLEKEFQYFLDHQAELVEKFNGKFVVIRDCSVVGAFDSEQEAIKVASAKFQLGSFLVQKCVPGAEGYTQTFHSRVCVTA